MLTFSKFSIYPRRQLCRVVGTCRQLLNRLVNISWLLHHSFSASSLWSSMHTVVQYTSFQFVNKHTYSKTMAYDSDNNWLYYLLICKHKICRKYMQHVSSTKYSLKYVCSLQIRSIVDYIPNSIRMMTTFKRFSKLNVEIFFLKFFLALRCCRCFVIVI